MNGEMNNNMNKFDDRDVQLTAYALGELDDEQAEAIEQQLQHDDEARQYVEQLQGTADALREGFNSEPAQSLTDDQRETIEHPRRQNAARIAAHARWFWAAGTLAAACLALAVVLVPGTVSTKQANTDNTFALRGAAEESRAEQLRNMGAGLRGHADSEAEPTSPPPEQEPASSGLQAAQPQRATKGASDANSNGKGGGFGGGGGGGQGQPTSVQLPWQNGAASTPQPSQYPEESRQLTLRRLHGDIPMLGGEIRRPSHQPNREGYDRVVDNPFIRPQREPLSTFSIDVDTAGYANVRRFINNNQLPPADAVRIEEMINYFNYNDPAPSENAEHPFAVNTEVGPAAWKPEHQLVRIGIKAQDVDLDMRPPTNLVFLLDVSGSMRRPNKLPLLKKSMKMLIDRLNADDRVAMVVYAGSSGLVLPSTYCHEKQTILDALDRLRAGGSTNGGAGIELAYQVAEENFIDGGINRVILATDGDFNVGVSSDAELVRLIEKKRESGVFLSVLGFGTGNIQDAKMEQLSNHGNGNFAYIDSVDEAEKVLVNELGGTIMTVAKDVKVQVDFNPAQVEAYRLIGYANRLLDAEDFADDAKDAGEIGAGHSITALYEIVPKGVEIDLPDVEPSKYAKPETSDEQKDDKVSDELLTVRLRYKQPDADTSTRFDHPVQARATTLEETSDDFRFASAVAAFGMLLRESPYKGEADYNTILDLAQGAVNTKQESGKSKSSQYRRQFIELVEKAKQIAGRDGDGDDDK